MKRCNKCERDLDEEQFSWKLKGKSRQAHCKSCHSQYRKRHYEDNRRKYLEKATKHRRVTAKVLREKMVKLLQGRCCQTCGFDNIVTLEFHHRNPDDKLMCVSDMLARNHSWAKILLEIEKCDILCANCHRIETAKQNNTYKHRATVGSATCS